MGWRATFLTEGADKQELLRKMGKAYRDVPQPKSTALVSLHGKPNKEQYDRIYGAGAWEAAGTLHARCAKWNEAVRKEETLPNSQRVILHRPWITRG
jgi:hypothetical protein